MDKMREFYLKLYNSRIYVGNKELNERDYVLIILTVEVKD